MTTSTEARPRRPSSSGSTETTTRSTSGSANASRLREILGPYIEASRRSNAYSAAEAPAIRAWATEHGFQVSERGRLHSDVIEAYRAAHP